MRLKAGVLIKPLQRTSRGVLDGWIGVHIRVVHSVVDWRIRMQIL